MPHLRFAAWAVAVALTLGACSSGGEMSGGQSRSEASAVHPSITDSTIRATTSHPSSATSGIIWVPKPEQLLPLPAFRFRHVYKRRPGTSVHSVGPADGILEIDGKCLYYRTKLDREEHGEEYEWLSVLALPQDLVQYDQQKHELWFHHRTHVEGPFTTGTAIALYGLHGRQWTSPFCSSYPIISAMSIELR